MKRKNLGPLKNPSGVSLKAAFLSKVHGRKV